MNIQEKNMKLKTLIQGITSRAWLVEYYIDQAQKLEKKDTIYNICDLDDTLCAREEQFQKHPQLLEHRWAEWNTYITNIYWLKKFIDDFYNKNTTIPHEILDTLELNNTLILTAWLHELQMWKIQGLWLEKYAYKIVDHWIDKILVTIRHCIYTLWYIPKTIKVYEDRPEHFIKYRELIEECLGTKLEIYYVEMDWNSWYKKIELTK